MTRIVWIALLCLCMGLPLRAEAATVIAAPPACAGKDIVAETRRQAPLLGWMLDWLMDWQIRFVANGSGILWRIEGKGAPPSYLLGTMHLTDERLIDLVPRLDRYLGPGHVLATELGEDLIGPAKYVLAGKLALRAMVLKGDSLAIIANPAERQSVDALLAEHGVPPAAASRVAPWLLAIAVSMPDCEQERQKRELPIFDSALTERARRAGTRIAALETADEQLAVLSAIPPDISSRILVGVARKTVSLDDGLATLTGLYLNHRSGMPLNPLMSWLLFGPTSSPAFVRTVVGNRNQVMRQRARPILENGNALIAVGALHLAGEGGLVALFRQDGYTVTREW